MKKLFYNLKNGQSMKVGRKDTAKMEMILNDPLNAYREVDDIMICNVSNASNSVLNYFKNTGMSDIDTVIVYQFAYSDWRAEGYKDITEDELYKRFKDYCKGTETFVEIVDSTPWAESSNYALLANEYCVERGC